MFTKRTELLESIRSIQSHMGKTWPSFVWSRIHKMPNGELADFVEALFAQIQTA